MSTFSSSALVGPQSTNTNQRQHQYRDRGFSATFNADFLPLKLGENVFLHYSQPVAMLSAKFGQELTYSCPLGQESADWQVMLQN